MEVKIAQQIVSEDCGSIIMDELSILHYQSDLNETTGQVSYKLVLFNFLELPGSTSSVSCCFKCEKPARDLKVCSRCRRARYCSVECQRSDWKQHKSICSSPPSN